MTPPKRNSRSSAFQMPAAQTMVSRKSSITNAFVNAILPVIVPTDGEVLEVLAILEISPEDVRCAYCGDPKSEWDHLRPLVVNLRPTGYISEIANLVPACGKCNQSKGNSPWRDWMLRHSAKRSPTARGIADVPERIRRLELFEKWREPIRIDFEAVLGSSDWAAYWDLWHSINEDMKKCQIVADKIQKRVLQSVSPRHSRLP